MCNDVEQKALVAILGEAPSDNPADVALAHAGALMPVVPGEVRSSIAEMRPIDDDFFAFLGREPTAMEEIIRVALGNDDLRVVRSDSRHAIDFFNAHSVVLDSECILEDGRIVNVEAQRHHNNDDPRRVRYHAATMSIEHTKKQSGMRYKRTQVPDVVVVYLMEYRSSKTDKNVYTVCRCPLGISAEDLTYEDGETIVFISLAVDDGSPAAALMHIMCERDAYDFERFPALSAAKLRIRGTFEEVGDMNEVLEYYIRKSKAYGMQVGLEQGIEQGMASGRAQGEASALRRAVDSLVANMGWTPRQAMAALGVDPAALAPAATPAVAPVAAPA